MAKIDLGNLGPDQWPRVKGAFLVRAWRGGYHATTWPPKRGDNQHPNSKRASLVWSQAARMSANYNSIDYQTAVAMTAGTDWMPRDLLMRAIYGKAITVIEADGTEWQRNTHLRPLAERTMVTQLVFNETDGLYAGATNVIGASLQGNLIQPYTSMSIRQLRFPVIPVAGASYVAVIAKLNVGTLITDIWISDTVVPLQSNRSMLVFEITADLEAMGRYALLICRTDAGPSQVIALTKAENSSFPFPYLDLGFGYVSTDAPAVGQTIVLPGTVRVTIGIYGDF